MRIPIKRSWPFFWRFEKTLRRRMKPLLPRMESDLYGEFGVGFRETYREVLRSLAESDTYVLKSAMETRLSNRLLDQLARLKRKGERLEVINPEAAVGFSLHNAKLHVNISADRHEQQQRLYGRYFEVSDSSSSGSDSDAPAPRLRNEDLLIYTPGGDPASVPAVFVVDCVYHSCAKLLLRNAANEVVRGRNDTDTERHTFRFETEFTSSFDSMMDYFIGGSDECVISSYNWILSDIDFCLRGNPFVGRLLAMPMPASDSEEE